ncbi:MAG: hypothetical protein JWN00_5996 [Actinomycetia bacterium]|nr:hypothetical protein [Actinomycetes bacterium]
MLRLTSTSFQIIMIVFTILITVGTLLLWNRVRGPRPVKLLSRITLLISSYLLAAMAVLVSINIAYGGLIASWSDLADNLNPSSSSAQAGRGPGWGGHGGGGHGWGGPGRGGPGRPGRGGQGPGGSTPSSKPSTKAG